MPTQATDLSCVTDSVQSDLCLGFGLLLVVRDACRLTSTLVAGPVLGQIEPCVDEAMALAAAKNSTDGDLAIVDLSQAAAILPGHTDGLAALFGKAGVIDDEAAVWLPADQVVDFDGDPIGDLAMAPGRGGHEMLDLLIVGLGHGVCHAFHIAALGLDQAKEIALCDW
jgi:hypothetical protein